MFKDYLFAFLGFKQNFLPNWQIGFCYKLCLAEKADGAFKKQNLLIYWNIKRWSSRAGWKCQDILIIS